MLYVFKTCSKNVPIILLELSQKKEDRKLRALSIFLMVSIYTRIQCLGRYDNL